MTYKTATSCLVLLIVSQTLFATDLTWQYPNKVNSRSLLECDCWNGINENGKFKDPIIRVDLERYLVGAPPSDLSAVTITTDLWIEVGFAGKLVDGPGPDLIVRELGRMGETALVFLSDGNRKTYALGIAEADDDQDQAATVCEFDLEHVQPGFAATAVRIMSLGLGGGSPGFDVGSVKARIEIQTGPPHIPLPANLATKVDLNASLRWTGSGQASTVDLYLGTDLNAVNPEESAPFATNLPADVNLFEPDTPWALGQTYYWRIVETTAAQQNIGEIWQFQVDPHYVVENFDLYTENPSDQVWGPSYPAVYSLTHCEESTYKGCNSAKLDYDLAIYKYAFISQYRHPQYSKPFDWGQPGATTLELFFRGVPKNSVSHRLYLKLENASRQTVEVIYTDDPNHINDDKWHSWRIDLTEFDSLDLGDIRGLTIGIRPTDNSVPTTGTLFIDEIQLCALKSCHDRILETDVSQDKKINPTDLALFADSWLLSDNDDLQAATPEPPWCHLTFDNSISDNLKQAQTQKLGVIAYGEGVTGQAIDFNQGQTISITNIAEWQQTFDRGITISFWQSGRDSIHRSDTLVCSNFEYPDQAPELAIGLGLWESPEVLFWQCGSRQDPQNLLTGIHQASEQWSERWNHWAFTKDFYTGIMCVYLNGRPLYHGQGQATGLSQIDNLTLGNGWYSHYDGLMDDFRIHDYALNAEECAYLATHGTGILPQPAILPSDFNGDGQVDWQDFACLASEWITSQ